eukprot:TRINITY_DN28037_c0_g1_i5.p2 TRINITY_DN28037_c0_g1~~TRINITY_DN28037_c0_g1_i5.p2  ORF type:complete len:288 (-),score=96.98 TRINITY_DN28037_c0_g1_i5:382-1245(-)
MSLMLAPPQKVAGKREDGPTEQAQQPPFKKAQGAPPPSTKKQTQQRQQRSQATTSTASGSGGPAPPALPSDALQQIVAQIAQLGLANAAAQRSLAAVSMRTLLLDRELATPGEEKEMLVDTLKHITKTHYETIQQYLKKEDKAELGPVHCHVWLETMAWLIRKFADITEPTEDSMDDSAYKYIQTIRDYMAKLKQMEVSDRRDELTGYMRHCRVARTFLKTKVKYEIGIGYEITENQKKVVQAAITLLKMLGAEEKQGSAPRNNQERTLAKSLAQMTGKERKADWDW